MYLEGWKDMVLKERLMKGAYMETGADQEGLSLCLFSSMKIDIHRPGSCEGKLTRVDGGGRPLLLLLQPGEFRSWCRRAALM